MSMKIVEVSTSPEQLSQDADVRLRQLEAATMLLLGEKVMSLKKLKIDKADLIDDLEDVARNIGYTVANYPDVVPEE